MSLKDDLDRLAAKMDMTERFPGYFNKWVFRAGLIFMVLLLGVVAYTDELGVKPRLYLECPADTVLGRCDNPFFAKTNCMMGSCDDLMLIRECHAPKEYADLCNKEYFVAGETYGTKPSWLQSNFIMIGLLVVVLCFAINHLLYWRRTGKWSY